MRLKGKKLEAAFCLMADGRLTDREIARTLKVNYWVIDQVRAQGYARKKVACLRGEMLLRSKSGSPAPL